MEKDFKTLGKFLWGICLAITNINGSLFKPRARNLDLLKPNLITSSFLLGTLSLFETSLAVVTELQITLEAFFTTKGT